MKVLENFSEQWENKTLKKNKIINKCNNACMKCLSCKYNQDSQYNLILQNLFNNGENLDDIKWRDVNLCCGLNNNT